MFSSQASAWSIIIATQIIGLFFWGGELIHYFNDGQIMSIVSLFQAYVGIYQMLGHS